MLIKIFFNTNIDLLEHKTTENPKTLLQCAVNLFWFFLYFT